VEPEVTGGRTLAARLSVGALGLSLAILVSVAWGTGLVYLAARLGLGSPVRPALLDGVHVYVGLVGGVFVAVKVARVGLRHRVRGVAGVVPWHRWISWSLLVLYSAVLVSGVVLLLPIQGPAYATLVNLHLLTSVWALLPTSWHVWHYRRRALPYLAPRRRLPGSRRYWLALAVALAPTVALVAAPRAISQLPQVQQGPGWARAALADHYVDVVTTTPDGRWLVAAGDALYLSRDGTSWSRVVPPAVDPTAGGRLSPELDIADGHANHEAPPSASLIHSVAIGGDAVYVGTNAGLFGADSLGQPLRQLAFERNAVQSLAIDPSNAQAIWAATASGPMHSGDGGRTWTRLADGLRHPTDVAALAYAGERIFASDRSGVYEWSAPSRAWKRRSGMSQVVALATAEDGVQLYAFSPTDGIALLSDGVWRSLTAPGQPHGHSQGGGGHVHLDLGGLTTLAGRIYVAGTADGVTASADGGRTWTQLAGGMRDAAPNQLTVFHDQLWAGTPSGLYRLPLSDDPAPTSPWWAAVVTAAVGLGLAAAALGAAHLTAEVRRARTAVAELLGWRRGAAEAPPGPQRR
jgi:photosystem II stability/assembly factor-like uncharacterized protein